MAHAINGNKDVRELQRLAEESSPSLRDARVKTRSRAALLELIDILSRWSAAGLALVAGIAVYLAIIAGNLYPGRAAAWVTLLLCALWICRRMRGQFRAGDTIAARPFRWRASYTSCLSVLGVVFASAPILLTPDNAPASLGLQVSLLIMLGAFGAAITHAAHLTSAATFAAPGAAMPVLAAIRSGDITLAMALTAASAVALVIVFAFSRTIATNAGRRNPRTRFVRREIERAHIQHHAANGATHSAL